MKPHKILIVGNGGMPSTLIADKIRHETNQEVVIISAEEAEKDRGITITNEPPPLIITPNPIFDYVTDTSSFKSGKQLRRERRKQQRKK